MPFNLIECQGSVEKAPGLNECLVTFSSRTVDLVRRVLELVFGIVSAIEEIDAILLGRMFLSVKGPGLVLGFSEGFEQGREVLTDIPLTARDKYNKPIVMVLNEEVTDVELIEFEVDRRNLRNYYLSHGIPVYPTVERAVRAITNVVKYNERLSQHSSG
jgi:hypothetical protein